MKNKKNLIILLCSIVVLLFLISQKSIYTINAKKIDDFSPDRILTVYKNNKKIDFVEIDYSDGVLLCSGDNPTVSYSEIINEKELIVKINNKKQVIAKIVEK